MLNLTSNARLILEDDEVAVVEEAGGADDVAVVLDEGTEDGPLVESPTRNVLPPIGATTPMVFSN